MLAVLMAISFGFWLVLVPVKVWNWLPEGVRSYLKGGSIDGSDTLFFLVIFICLPVALSVAAALAIVTWAIVARPFATREEVETFYHSGLFSGSSSRLEALVLDAIYGKRIKDD